LGSTQVICVVRASPTPKPLRQGRTLSSRTLDAAFARLDPIEEAAAAWRSGPVRPYGKRGLTAADRTLARRKLSTLIKPS
jgi:hypothetical protein